MAYIASILLSMITIIRTRFFHRLKNYLSNTGYAKIMSLTIFLEKEAKSLVKLCLYILYFILYFLFYLFYILLLIFPAIILLRFLLSSMLPVTCCTVSFRGLALVYDCLAY